MVHLSGQEQVSNLSICSRLPFSKLVVLLPTWKLTNCLSCEGICIEFWLFRINMIEFSFVDIIRFFVYGTLLVITIASSIKIPNKIIVIIRAKIIAVINRWEFRWDVWIMPLLCTVSKIKISIKVIARENCM